MVSITTVFKVTVLLLLMSSVTSKSFGKRSVNREEENEIENIQEQVKTELVLKQQKELEDTKEKEIKESGTNEERPEDKKQEETSEKTTENREKPANENDGHKAIDPTASTDHSDNPRSSRTIAQLREVESPETILENFRHKLKTARSNLEENLAARKAAQPRLFLFDPNAEKIRPLGKLPLARTAQQASTLEAKPANPTASTNTNQTPAEEAKKIITSPVLDDSSSSSEEHSNTNGASVTNQGSSLSQSSRSVDQSEDITQLLHVREEISKIRHMMQELREQQMRQQFAPQVPHTRNFTDHEDLASIIEKLKEQGKISTGSLNGELQNHPPETTKLVEDIQKLKQSVLSFAKHVGGPKSNIGSLSDLEKQIKQQREEIDALKKLVDGLQPPRNFPVNPVMIKQPQNVKSDLSKELGNLQDILNELLRKEEEKERFRSAQEKQRTTDDIPVKKTEEEIGTLMKIFQSISHPANGESRQSIEAKLEKLERELKDLDSQNQRTRQELLLQKLEHDIKSMKSSKFTVHDEENLREQIRRLEENLKHQSKKKVDPMSSKISALASQLKQMNKPQSRGTDIPKNIEMELDKLQREIDLMTLKNLEKSGDKMSSRQLQSLFSDILNPSGNESPIIDSIDLLTDIIKEPLKKIDTIKDIDDPILPSKIDKIPDKFSKIPGKLSIIPGKLPDIPGKLSGIPDIFSEIPGKLTDIPSKLEFEHPDKKPIYQIPYCLKNYPHSHSEPVYHPYLSGHEETSFQEPIKIQHQQSGAYGPSQSISQAYNNGYEQKSGYGQQIKMEERPGYNIPRPMKVQGYNNGYKGPIKTEEQKSGYGQQIKYEERPKVYNQGPMKPQGYNNGYKQPIKIEEQKSGYGQQVKYEERPKAYNQGPMKPQGYNNGYKQPIKIEEQKSGYGQQQVKYEERPKGYNQGPIKQQGYGQPIKVEEQSSYGKQENDYGIKQQIEYNNEEYKPMKIQEQSSGYGQQSSQYNKEIPESKPEVIHQYYQPTVPKVTPVKIKFPPQETEQQEYGYQPEEMQYQPDQYKPPCSHETGINEEMNHLNGMIGNLDEKINYGQDMESNYELYRSKNYKPRNKRDVDDDMNKKQIYMDIQQRLATLREAVESEQEHQNSLNSSENDLAFDFQRAASPQEYYPQYDNKDYYPLKYKKKQKFDNLFIKIVKFILHKLEISAPYVVESLFDSDVYGYDNDGYESSYKQRSAEQNDYNIDDNGLQNYYGGMNNNFQGFPGLLGIIPTIIVKLFSNFSSFLRTLKRNNFFKNFIFPNGLILAVDGIMALLIWWFSSN